MSTRDQIRAQNNASNARRFAELKNALSRIGSLGSDLNPTKTTSPDELNAIKSAIDDNVRNGRNLLEKQDFASCGKAVFRLDAPRHKPTYEIQRNGPKAQSEQTTVACVCTAENIQVLINALPNSAALQELYNEILWGKLRESLEKKKNMNVTLADLGAILTAFETNFR